MGAKSKGGGTGRGTGSKGWTRWNKTAKPVKPAKGAPTTGPGAKDANGSKGNNVKKSGSTK
ncbi:MULTISPECIES: DUF3934 family protein [Paenibacillus]|uniref:DUF3934 domain-containing protein n=1 Tax=Paenibacillus odorifer TaxID=189426 RepID=A0A1R0Y6B4_9BACL|nr:MULTISPECIES: DUF3934 family protein [Paenibacillus]AIQ35435.1 hypothetical protein R50345_12925 [Paenibacillus sp. FSL R5-0345]OMD42890.1 DUF3934 domain-containing protein [Paenibacillus odorifer]